MASPAMKLSIFLLLTLFSTLPTHARDSQLFNKIPSTTNTNTNTNNVVVPTNQQDPNFLPENENSYGLYSQETGQNPPSTAAEYKQPLNKYLPKNYNPVAYVTQPESEEERTFTTNPNNNNNNNNNDDENRNSYYSGEENYYNNQQQLDEAEFRSYPTTTTTAANNRDNGVANFYLGSSFNSGPAFRNRANTFQPQGMSDTRHLEGGKYFYDVNSEKYSSNHPYETLKAARPQNDFTNTNFYGNNAYEQHFQDEENMP